MALSPIDVAQRQFKTVLRGYSPRDVEVFLHDASEAMTELVQQNNVLKAELSVRQKLLDNLQGRENDVKEALVTAQQAVEQVRSGADKEAKLKTDAAEVRASKIVADAEARLSSLSQQVGELSRQRARFIEELRGMIATHARMLELYGQEGSRNGPSFESKQPARLEVLEAPIPPAFLESSTPRHGNARPSTRRGEGRVARQKE